MIFSGPMVKAILDGRKTQTRRVVKAKTVERFNTIDASHSGAEEFAFAWREYAISDEPMSPYALALKSALRNLCPYGVPGDRLWVRETWASATGLRTEPYAYRADGQFGIHMADGESRFFVHHGWINGIADETKRGTWVGLGGFGGKWRSPRYMPRWASRISLEVKDVQVERVQEITGEDVFAEGVGNDWQPDSNQRGCFRRLWDSINAKRGYGWETNPWVWVVTFERITP